MTSQQVQYLLGTPILIDPYNNYTWYYVFLQQRAYETPVQHTFTVKFDQRGIVTETHLDKPLPQVSQQGENNTIIETGEKTKIKLVEILEIIFYFHRTTIRIIGKRNLQCQNSYSLMMILN